MKVKSYCVDNYCRNPHTAFLITLCAGVWSLGWKWSWTQCSVHWCLSGPTLTARFDAALKTMPRTPWRCGAVWEKAWEMWRCSTESERKVTRLPNILYIRSILLLTQRNCENFLCAAEQRDSVCNKHQPKAVRELFIKSYPGFKVKPPAEDLIHNHFLQNWQLTVSWKKQNKKL